MKKKGARYTPIARRQDRPDAIAWFLKNHPEVPDSKVVKLIGTTKATIEQVRNRTHWNSSQIKPVDPVTIGLCSQIELDAVVADAAAAKARADKRAAKAEAKTLKSAQETVPSETYEQAPEATPADEEENA
ncbi:MAG: cell cycle transcriptional regulator TrcR [Hyphomonadaceae bacterium]